jgi:hypothetical protein
MIIISQKMIIIIVTAVETSNLTKYNIFHIMCIREVLGFNEAKKQLP